MFTSTHLEWAPRTLPGQRSWHNLWWPLSRLDQDQRIKRNCATHNLEKQMLHHCLGPEGHTPVWPNTQGGEGASSDPLVLSKELSVQTPYFLTAEDIDKLFFMKEWGKYTKKIIKISCDSSARDNHFEHFDVYDFSFKKFTYRHVCTSSFTKIELLCNTFNDALSKHKSLPLFPHISYFIILPSMDVNSLFNLPLYWHLSYWQCIYLLCKGQILKRDNDHFLLIHYVSLSPAFSFCTSTTSLSAKPALCSQLWLLPVSHLLTQSVTSHQVGSFSPDLQPYSDFIILSRRPQRPGLLEPPQFLLLSIPKHLKTSMILSLLTWGRGERSQKFLVLAEEEISV